MRALLAEVRTIYARDHPVFRRTESPFRQAFSRSVPKDWDTTSPALATAAPSAGPTAHTTIVPVAFDDAQRLADTFKSNHPVVLDLVAADRGLQRRLIDFATGICYVLGGTMRRLGPGRYLLIPRVVASQVDDQRDVAATWVDWESAEAQARAEGLRKLWFRGVEEDDVDAMFSRANELQHFGDLEGAETLWRRAADEGHVDSMGFLGALLLRSGRMEEAEAWLRRAIQEGDADSMLFLGELLARRGAVEEAKEWWGRAALEGDENALRFLGDLLRDQGRLGELEEWYRVTHAAEVRRRGTNPPGAAGRRPREPR